MCNLVHILILAYYAGIRTMKLKEEYVRFILDNGGASASSQYVLIILWGMNSANTPASDMY